MKIIKRVAKAISNLIFYLLLAIIVLLIVYVITIKVYQKQNRLGDIPINLYTILTQSMYPTIKAGDIVITYKTKDNIYKEKDVITFVSESNASKGITITHRIVGTTESDGKKYYYTKGDGNNTADTSPVSSSSVIGKVIIKIPKAGYIQQFMVSKFGWLVVVVLPCLAIIIYDVVKIFEKIFKIKVFKTKTEKKLSLKETQDERENLNNIINSQFVTVKSDEQTENLFEEPEDVNKKQDIQDKEKEDDNVEIL